MTAQEAAGVKRLIVRIEKAAHARAQALVEFADGKYPLDAAEEVEAIHKLEAAAQYLLARYCEAVKAAAKGRPVKVAARGKR